MSPVQSSPVHLSPVIRYTPKMIGHRRSKWLELYFRLPLSESLSSQSHWYPFWNSDIPTSQSALKQSYSEETNGENNDDKARKPTLGSHSISVNQCNIFAYFRVMNNKFKAVLTVLSCSHFKSDLEPPWQMFSSVCGCTGWWHNTIHFSLGAGMAPFIFLQVLRTLEAVNQLRMDTTLEL